MNYFINTKNKKRQINKNDIIFKLALGKQRVKTNNYINAKNK